MRLPGAGRKTLVRLVALVGARRAEVVRWEQARPAVHPRLAALTAAPSGVARWTAGRLLARRLLLPGLVVVGRRVGELRVTALRVVTASVSAVTVRCAAGLGVAQVVQQRARRGTARRVVPQGVVVGRADTRLRVPPAGRRQRAPIAATSAGPGRGESRALWDVKPRATSTPRLAGHRAVRTVATFAGPCRRAVTRPPLDGKDRQAPRAPVRLPAELPSREGTGAQARPRPRRVDLLGEALSG